MSILRVSHIPNVLETQNVKLIYVVAIAHHYRVLLASICTLELLAMQTHLLNKFLLSI